MPTTASKLARLMFGVASAVVVSGCVKTDAPRLAAGNPPIREARNETAGLTAQEDVARRWAAAYAADPDNAAVALQYARTLKAQGLDEQALQILRRAYEATKDPAIASELGRLALEAGDLATAGPALQAALAASPGDWRLISAQGALHAQRGEHDKAQDQFLAALAQNPNSPAIINNLALSYAMDGKQDRAKALLEEALDRSHDPRLAANLAYLERQQPKETPAAVVATLRGAVAATPGKTSKPPAEPAEIAAAWQTQTLHD